MHVRVPVHGIGHALNAVINCRVAHHCNTRKLPSSAVSVAFRNTNNRSVNTFVPHNRAVHIYNRIGSCTNGNLSNKHLVMHPRSNIAFSPRRGIVTNGIANFNTASKRLFITNHTNRHFNIHGSNTAFIIRNINSRNYRCVAKNTIIILNSVNHGFNTNFSNNGICILSLSVGRIGPATTGSNSLLFLPLSSRTRTLIRSLIGHRTRRANSTFTTKLLGS